MGLAASLFYSTAAPEKCLDWRIRPSDEQFEAQKARWNDLADVLLTDLKTRSGCPTSSWLQGSYKFGTQIRPASSGQEFDIDLGVYFGWDGQPEDGRWSPVELKEFVQDSLIAYAQDATNDAEGVSEAKPRCSRIHFRDDFHIDVPCYHLDAKRDSRALAVGDGNWEDSDPKAIYKWWKDTIDDVARPRLRRIVRYVKMWAALHFGEEETPPSSILLTVLVAQAYGGLGADKIDGDDDLLHSILAEISARLGRSAKVANPVHAAEDLNRLGDDAHKVFVDRLASFLDIAARATASKSKAAAAEIWAEAFRHFIEVPDENDDTLLLEKAFGAPTVSFMPEVAVTATSKSSPRQWTGTNAIGPIPKNCSIEFALSNALQLPAGAVVSWTVRNGGRAAERENDLGHYSGEGLSTTESSAYPGRHYVDVAVKVNGNLIGRRRVPVDVSSLGIVPRNPKRRPAYALRPRR
ncbi:CBASS cGAMP synthase [Brevundimonas diminuta]|uniref:CBASS cGAMP synthase n=1 Tax=Brevundimonas diminuta TaxID=293 RepID=UPI003207C9EF